jgi:hypothetical protein
MRFQHLKEWRRAANDALDRGGIASIATIKWDVSANCSSPVYREYRGLMAPKVFTETVRSRGPALTMELEVRCRKCVDCLRARAFHWRKRAETELKRTAGRTWFGTLTFKPQRQMEAQYSATLRLRRSGIVYEALTAHEQFLELCRELGPEITKWLKRLRKETGTRFRYLLVAEAHKSGLPHMHILLHEATGPIRKETLQRQWARNGFSSFKLVAQLDQKPAAYVCKYLSKSAISRVRCSAGYGQDIAPCATLPSGIGREPTVKNHDPRSDATVGSEEQRELTDVGHVSGSLPRRPSEVSQAASSAFKGCAETEGPAAASSASAGPADVREEDPYSVEQDWAQDPLPACPRCGPAPAREGSVGPGT